MRKILKDSSMLKKKSSDAGSNNWKRNEMKGRGQITRIPSDIDRFTLENGDNFPISMRDS